jgi:hypothetical protein
MSPDQADSLDNIIVDTFHDLYWHQGCSFRRPPSPDDFGGHHSTVAVRGTIVPYIVRLTLIAELSCFENPTVVLLIVKAGKYLFAGFLIVSKYNSHNIWKTALYTFFTST